VNQAYSEKEALDIEDRVIKKFHNEHIGEIKVADIIQFTGERYQLRRNKIQIRGALKRNDFRFQVARHNQFHVNTHKSKLSRYQFALNLIHQIEE
jgi:hypothetical protein